METPEAKDPPPPSSGNGLALLAFVLALAGIASPWWSEYIKPSAMPDVGELVQPLAAEVDEQRHRLDQLNEQVGAIEIPAPPPPVDLTPLQTKQTELEAALVKLQTTPAPAPVLPPQWLAYLELTQSVRSGLAIPKGAAAILNTPALANVYAPLQTSVAALPPLNRTKQNLAQLLARLNTPQGDWLAQIQHWLERYVKVSSTDQAPALDPLQQKLSQHDWPALAEALRALPASPVQAQALVLVQPYLNLETQLEALRLRLLSTKE